MSEGVTKTREAIAEEAAAWFVEFQGQPPGRSAKRRFVSWLTESPVHVEEYLAIAKVFGALQHMDPKGEIDAETIAQETVVALHGEFGGLEQIGRESEEADWSSVPASRAGGLDQRDSIGELQQQGGSRPRSLGRKAGGLRQWAGRAKPVGRRASWTAAAAIVLGAGASALYIQGVGPDTYSTRLGEQRSVVLEDGSMVTLNTQSTMRVHFSDARRLVELVEGEALFDVEKDVARPFLVETGAAVIRVTGTQFNVYDRDEGTAVTVLEGQVEIAPREVQPEARAAKQSPGISSGSAGGVAKLVAGDQAVVKSGSAEIQTITVASLEPVTAWTERRLVFDATPLSEIVEQFNRYNRERLVLDDPSLASLELSGVFGSHDPQSLVLFLQRISDVDVVTSADGREIRIRAVKTAP
jgi:transmembrane sensor